MTDAAFSFGVGNGAFARMHVRTRARAGGAMLGVHRRNGRAARAAQMSRR
ncbi:hypothetical protein C7S16_2988 [Burkholderia thailandensis]|uniref:Uncharacterized protein n=1 Tax=Burkholderia thailandensis TaxID=57975 RepID=A0AAW9D0I9_BURTH|nr:hypothetical protein [Burkholderia thailandensis]MDW9256720.1 hypothetical protein [Burkholderia thailandensis]